MNRRFEGRAAVVTGGASGIGLAIVRGFADEGAHVALLDVDRARGEQAARDLGRGCEFFPADVGSESDVAGTVDRILDRFHGIDHLVNNAGVVLVKSLEESTGEDWDRVMSVNAKAAFLTMKHCLPALRSAVEPTIVNIGSISCFVGQKLTPIYVASKGAVALLSMSVALDYAKYGIRVNCVSPGITDTPMLRFHVSRTPDPETTIRERTNRVPLGRLLTGEDIANAVLYLSCRESSAITGTNLVVDGGYLAAAEWSND